MKTNALLILLALSLFTNILYAQADTSATSKYKIEFVKNESGQAYFYRDIRIGLKEIPPIVKSNPEAYKLARKAYHRTSNSYVVGAIGGFLVGFQLGRYITGGDPNWILGGVGGALIIVSIPLMKSADKKMQKAVRIYNDGLQEEPIAGYKLELAGSPNGIGLRLRF